MLGLELGKYIYIFQNIKEENNKKLKIRNLKTSNFTFLSVENYNTLINEDDDDEIYPLGSFFWF